MSPQTRSTADESPPGGGRSPASTYLFVVPWDTHHVGGVNGVVLNLARALPEVSTLVPLVAVNDWTARRPRRAGDQLRFRFSLLGEIGWIALFKSAIRLPARLHALDRLLRDERVAVVNFHYLSDAALGVCLLKMTGRYNGKVLLSLHGADAVRPSSRLRAWAVEFCLRSADAIVVVSKGLAARVAEQLDVPAAKLSIIGNGVDHSVFNPSAGEVSSRLGPLPARYLVSVGRYIPRKDHGTTIQALAILAPRFPDLHLCIAGDDSAELESLRRQSQDLGLAARTHFLRALSPAQVAYLLARAEVFVQASLSEGLPLTAIEAAAAGTAMVLSAIPGHDEIVEPGVDGLLFPARDPVACAAAIARLLDHPAERLEMARRMREHALARFSWSRSIAAYLETIGG
jgi:glycosyltransferase involved in cell wall biosynthesis